MKSDNEYEGGDCEGDEGDNESDGEGDKGEHSLPAHWFSM